MSSSFNRIVNSFANDDVYETVKINTGRIMITVSSILITCLAKLLVLSSLYLSCSSLVGDSERYSGTRGHIIIFAWDKENFWEQFRLSASYRP